ncbi:MAG: galactose-1-phosphate uridylyltransferase [Actinomycetota bacterium]|nr:galactose-1-phosphate uridylyltransferase [Actinomycetota bacterium]
MSQLRFNPLAGRWVAVAADRAARPQDFASTRVPVEPGPRRPCPFCPGNEEETPPALETYGPQGRWLVRVVPNLYPAFVGSGALEVTEISPLFHQAPAKGIHEVLVLGPDHSQSWADLDDRQTALVMAAIRDRVEEHARARGIAYTQVIVNHGREAGASIEHPHGQLLGIPFVPTEIAEELRATQSFPDGPLMKVLIEAELEAACRIVHDDEQVLVVCPFWAGSPYELLVVPKTPAAHLDNVAPADLVAVGRAIRTSLRRIRSLLGDVAYNIVFHSAPHDADGDSMWWHVHIRPAVTTTAGFEQGTGVRINVVPPELAASQLTSATVTADIRH